MADRVIFLDRDGTLNEDRGFVHRVEDWQFIPGVPGALRELQAAGYKLALASNQSGIGRGYFSWQDVHRLHQHLRHLLTDHGVRLDAVAICPHAPEDGCTCRKPRTGLARQIESQLPAPIAYRDSWIIGDKLSDVRFGKALGTRTALLISRYWTPGSLDEPPDIIADSLATAVRALIARSANNTNSE